MKVLLIFFSISSAIAFAQLKVCYGPLCGSVDSPNIMKIDYLGSVGDVATKAWESFTKMLTSAPDPTNSPTSSPPSKVAQPEKGSIPFDPYDIVVKFTSIEEFIAKGSQVEIAADLIEKLKASPSLRDFDLDTFVGRNVVVNSMFKQGMCWFCQRLSGVTNAFLPQFNFATEGFSAKRVNLLDMNATLVDVQGYGFPVKVLSSAYLIYQQILEEITHKVLNLMGDEFIQVIDIFSQEGRKVMMSNTAQAQAMDRLAR